MTLPDMAGSRAVLIGNASGVKNTDLIDLPAVVHNVKALRAALTDGTVWSLPPVNCVELLSPESNEVVKRAVKAASEAASDTLLVYYAGHGVRAGSDDSLYLTLPHIEDFDEGLRYNDLRSRLQPPIRRGRRTVVILDCCYAGLAGDGHMGGEGGSSAEFAKQAQVDGVGLFAAAAATRKALAPKGEQHTAFTGALLDVLRAGDPEGPEYLALNDVFQAVSQRLTERRKTLPLLPEPQLKTKDLGSRIILARNGSYRAPEPSESPPLPVQVPAPASAPAPPPLDEIVTLCRAHKLLVRSDRNVSQRVANKVRDDLVHERKEQLLAFYRWRRGIDAPRAIAVTDWGVRLHMGMQRMSIPFAALQHYEFKRRVEQAVMTPQGNGPTPVFLEVTGPDDRFRLSQPMWLFGGPSVSDLVGLLVGLRGLTAG